MRSPVHCRAQLALIVSLLLGQFFLRAHNPLVFAAFVDENHHIRRAQIVYDFDRNPVEYSHGKLLFYYWLGLFGPEEVGALAVGRLAVALFSLVGSAATAAVARALFGRGAILPALAFYALAPYALFFERMTLADPFAGGLATLAVWQSIRLVRAPSRGRGAAVGLLAALSPMAKLTTAPIVGLPFVAALLLDNTQPSSGDRTAIRARIGELWARYHRALVAALRVGSVVWGIFLLGVLESELTGRSRELFSTQLVDGEPGITDLADNLRNVSISADRFLSTPMALVLIGLAALLVWRRPMVGVFALSWLLALWGPVIVLASPVFTRYLMPGVPVLAVIFGGGMVLIGNLLAGVPGRFLPPSLVGAQQAASLQSGRTSLRQVQAGVTNHTSPIVTIVVLGLWAVGFALPFAWNTMHDPARLSLPDRDVRYISGSFAAWGTRESLEYLAGQGERINGQIPAVGVLRHCGSISLHVTDDFAWACQDVHAFPDRKIPADVNQWSLLLEHAQAWPFVYLITEYTEYVPLDAPPTNTPLAWELLFTNTRPLGGRTVAVWRVTRARTDSGQNKEHATPCRGG